MLLFFSFILIMSGCSNKSTSNRKPVINIQVVPSNTILKWGETYTINLESKVKKMKIKKMDLYLNGKLIKSTDNETLNITINSKEYLPGNISIKVESTNSDGINGINYSNVIIASDIKPEKSGYVTKGSISHNNKNFTEGFEFYGDKLFESTGNHGESYIYSYNPSSDQVISSLKLDNEYFGEGITVLNDKIFQLTYKTKKGFVYDVKTFKKIKEFSFTSEEGWGMTNDGKNLIMSDGTSKIHFIDPNTFERIKTIEVCDNNGIISNINELEYVDGVIYANIWMTQTILKIDAQNGRVLAIINMSGLQNQFDQNKIDVLNGIAYNRKENLFYVTGKYWPKTFKVIFK